MNGTPTCPAATAARLLGKSAVVGVMASGSGARGMMELLRREAPGKEPEDSTSTSKKGKM